MFVVDKGNGGKADALNVGLNVSRTPLVCCVDSDTLTDKHALLRMIEPFLYSEDNVVAVGGTVRLANGCTIKDGLIEKVSIPRSWLARFQIVEYLRAFLFGRIGFNRLGGNLIISGAFGLFLREKIIEVGGYRDDTVGEDMELVVRLHRVLREKNNSYRIVYLPDPIAYTEAPETLKVLNLQRERWHRGLCDSLWRHRSMFFNYKYGSTGLIVFPAFVIFEFLGPVIEIFGYYWFGISLFMGGIDTKFALLFFILAVFVGFLISVQSIVLDALSFNIYKGPQIRARLLLAAWFENFGYRQFTLFCRLQGLFHFLLGGKSWGKMTRKGFTQEPGERKPYTSDQPRVQVMPEQKDGESLETEKQDSVTGG